jgi:ComF family protein
MIIITADNIIPDARIMILSDRPLDFSFSLFSSEFTNLFEHQNEIARAKAKERKIIVAKNNEPISCSMKRLSMFKKKFIIRSYNSPIDSNIKCSGRGTFLFHSAHKFLSTLKDICFPLTCCNCGQFVDSEGLCSECWKTIKWTGDPKCRICGIPFEIDVDMLCPECLRKKPHFDKAISVFEYDDFSKDMILKFKHGDMTFMSRQLAAWIYRASENEIKNADIIVPVPIHFFKRLKRKYNQSELLAQELEKISGIPCEPRILQKIKSTPQQEGLSRSTRLKNINGSFGVNPEYSPRLNAKTVVLLDDVLTTGSTAGECSKILKKHGATKVIVLTIARVSLVR